MKKTYIIIIVALIALAGLKLLSKEQSSPNNDNNPEAGLIPTSDYKNIAYTIEGREIKLENGFSEISLDSDSASTIKTQYFGNELRTDLNGDDREDVAFILTQSTGGSGLFYYTVAALNTQEGYIGSDGYLLGDRIAPQPTTISPDPKQKYVVVFNYADRKSEEPMTASPSVGKSTYLKLDPKTFRWAIVLSPEDRESL